MTYRIIETCTGCTACVRVCPTQAIRGARSRKHEIEPGVCIECGACGLICPAAAVIDASGQPCRFVKRSLWPKPVVLAALCISCGACSQACPVSVLGYPEPMVVGAGMKPARIVHLIPYLQDEKGCIACAFCEATCPVQAIVMKGLAQFST